MKRIALIACLFIVSACSSGSEAPHVTTSQTPDYEWKAMPVGSARMFLDGTPALGVRHLRLKDDTVIEQTTLPNESVYAGENVLRVTYVPEHRTDLVQPPDLPDEQASTRIDRLLPHMTPQMAKIKMHNRYGSYEYVTVDNGEADPCVFAWQIIDDIRARVEYRFCGPAASPLRLLAPYTHLTMKDNLQQDLNQIRDIQEMASAAANQFEQPAASNTKHKLQPLLNPEQENDAFLIQSRLSYMGLYHSVPDGKWGPASQDALRRFKRSAGLDDDDRWSLETQEKLFQTEKIDSKQLISN